MLGDLIDITLVVEDDYENLVDAVTFADVDIEESVDTRPVGALQQLITWKDNSCSSFPPAAVDTHLDKQLHFFVPSTFWVAVFVFVFVSAIVIVSPFLSEFVSMFVIIFAFLCLFVKF